MSNGESLLTSKLITAGLLATAYPALLNLRALLTLSLVSRRLFAQRSLQTYPAFVDMTTGSPVWAAGRYTFAQSDIKTLQDAGIKVMVAVGGWNLDTAFRPASKTEEARSTFAKGVVGFVKQYGLDGIDLDWE